MSKVVKQMMIDSIRSELGACREVLVLDASKLDGVTCNRLRLALHKKKIRLLGVKNAIARKALSEVGITGIDKVLTGPSTLAFGGEDIVALSRELTEWVQKIKTLEIRGGSLGPTALSPADVESLSKSPGRVELLGQVVGLILSPGARLAAALGGPAGKIAGQIKAIADRDAAGS